MNSVKLFKLGAKKILGTKQLATSWKKKFYYQFGNFYAIYASNKHNVRVIAKRTLRDFWEKHADCEEQLKSWYRETEKSEWKSIDELKNDYPSATLHIPTEVLVQDY